MLGCSLCITFVRNIILAVQQRVIVIACHVSHRSDELPVLLLMCKARRLQNRYFDLGKLDNAIAQHSTVNYSGTSG